MGKPYGKLKRETVRRPKRAAKDGTFLRIRFVKKDRASLTMQDLRDGLYEAARRLGKHEDTLRIKWAGVTVQLVDARGRPVLPDGEAEWEIDVYECAADKFDR